METNTYTILTAKQEEVTKKLNRLAKKAKKYDIPFSVSFGEPYAITKKYINDYGYVVESKYEVVDLTIESETIKKDGYTVIAHIEHTPTGNIVNVFEGEMKHEWVTIAPFCVHCNSNHNLKYTFMVSNGEETKQVGRNCLQEYCGINPQMIGMMNAFYDEIEEYTAERFDGEGIPCVFDATQVLAIAIETIKEQGYIKSDERDSNKSKINRAISENHHPSKEFMDKAVQMADAIMAMDIDEAIDARLNNVQARLKGFYCKPSDFGYFAYAPVAFEKNEKRKAELKRREEERNTMGAQSEYVGEVGERAEFDIKEIKMLTSFATNYGYTYLYRLLDVNGNVMIWFASSSLVDADYDKLEKGGKIKATVKSHSERDGIKQTIITRVKVA